MANGLNWKVSVTNGCAELHWHDTKVCETCWDEMTGKRAAARYCSAKCKQSGHRQEKSDREWRERFMSARGMVK